MKNHPKTEGMLVPDSEYFHAMAGELAMLARIRNLPTLAHLFEMAEQESVAIGDARPSEIIRVRRKLGR